MKKYSFENKIFNRNKMFQTFKTSWQFKESIEVVFKKRFKRKPTYSSIKYGNTIGEIDFPNYLKILY